MECCGSREISGYKLFLYFFLTSVVIWDGRGVGNLTYTAISLGLLGLPWSDNRQPRKHGIRFKNWCRAKHDSYT